MPENVKSLLTKILHELGDNRRETDAMRQEVTQTRQEVTGMRQELSGIQQELAGTQLEVSGMRQELTETRHTLALEIINTRQVLEARIDGVEGKLGSFRDEALGHFDEVYRRLDRLEIEYQAICSALIRVEKKLSEEPSSREELKKEVEDLKARLAQLEKKLAELEQELHDSADA